MARYLVMLIAWLMVIAVLFGVVFPAVNEVVTAFPAGASDGAVGSETFNLTRDVTYLWVPVMLSGCVILIGFILAYGIRGTSMRP